MDAPGVVTAAQLRRIMPDLGADAAGGWVVALAPAMAAGQVLPGRRAAMFLAQAASESGGLSRLVEDLHYSPAGLLANWPHRFDEGLAAELARRPREIAEHVYGGRGGNGPEGSGDGWLYRGRGVFQLTFKDNYAVAGKRLGVDLVGHPELAAEPVVAARVAVDYWLRHGLSVLADAGDLAGVTLRINGGLTGLAVRRMYYTRALGAYGTT